MTSSLSNLVNNLSEAIYKIKCKHKHENKKCETRGIKHKYCSCFPEYSNFKNDLIDTNVSVTTKIINRSLMKA